MKDSFFVQPKNNLRPCLVNGERALFHLWAPQAYVVEPSIMRDSPGGQVYNLWGLVEMENGSMQGVPPESIRFLDSKHKKYSWPDTEDFEWPDIEDL